MQFQRIHPPDELRDIAECYWTAVNDSNILNRQKIVPDGFPEIIFHFGQPYKINISGTWELQTENLIAGQLTKYFFLENTGRSDIFGIKLKPAAVTAIFDIDMSTLKNKTVDISSFKNSKLLSLTESIRRANTHTKRIDEANTTLKSMRLPEKLNENVNQAVELILSNKGNITVTEICRMCKISERQLERLFKLHIGLSPKFYTRIIRFSHIFEVMQKQKISWTQVGLDSGYYDQAHFIKNFKTFTGEDPAKYFFDEPTMANFFLKKSP